MNPPTFREIKDVIDGVVVVNLDTFNDHRGLNYEGYNEDVYSQHPAFKALVFRVDAFSRSQKNVLRGFHGDKFNYKLIQIWLLTVKCIIDAKETDHKRKQIKRESIIKKRVRKKKKKKKKVKNSTSITKLSCVGAITSARASVSDAATAKE